MRPRLEVAAVAISWQRGRLGTRVGEASHPGPPRRARNDEPAGARVYDPAAPADNGVPPPPLRQIRPMLRLWWLGVYGARYAPTTRRWATCAPSSAT